MIHIAWATEVSLMWSSMPVMWRADLWFWVDARGVFIELVFMGGRKEAVRAHLLNVALSSASSLFPSLSLLGEPLHVCVWREDLKTPLEKNSCQGIRSSGIILCPNLDRVGHSNSCHVFLDRVVMEDRALKRIPPCVAYVVFKSADIHLTYVCHIEAK